MTGAKQNKDFSTVEPLHKGYLETLTEESGRYGKVGRM